MATAMKCDRCGECFDPFNMAGPLCRFKNPRFMTANDIREGVVGRRLIQDDDYDGNDADILVDLCPVCAQAFEKFMANHDDLYEDLLQENAQLKEIIATDFEERTGDVKIATEVMIKGLMEDAENADPEVVKSYVVDILHRAADRSERRARGDYPVCRRRRAERTEQAEYEGDD